MGEVQEFHKHDPHAKNRIGNITPKQINFVRELVDNDGMISAAEAARRAGYSEKAAKNIACNLQNPRLFPHVVKAIEEAREEQRKIYEVNRERHYRDLATIRNRALQENNFSAAVQAEKARGQAAGLYIERKEVRHGSIDAMSRDEVEEKIKQILGENGKLIEMVPQESNEEEVDTSEDRT